MKRQAEHKTVGLTRRQVELIVHGLVPFATPSDSAYKACAVMLAALFVGPKPQMIADVMGYDHDYVNEVATRMRASGMWDDAETHYSFELAEWDQSINTLDALMDSMVAEGKLARTAEKRDGKYIYKSLIYNAQQSAGSAEMTANRD